MRQRSVVETPDLVPGRDLARQAELAASTGPIRANVPGVAVLVQSHRGTALGVDSGNERGDSVRKLMALITLGCDGRPAEAARQVLDGETLIQRTLRLVQEAGPDRVLLSAPDDSFDALASAEGIEALARSEGARTLEQALSQALDLAGPDVTHVLALDPLLPLRRPGRLGRALAMAVREGADCVFSCHRESALLWQRSAMGLVPYFDPERRPGLDATDGEVPWLKEDGGFYLLRAETFRTCGSRHGGRIMPLETEPAEAVVADGSAGLAVCRALLAERERASATI